MVVDTAKPKATSFVSNVDSFGAVTTILYKSFEFLYSKVPFASPAFLARHVPFGNVGETTKPTSYVEARVGQANSEKLVWFSWLGLTIFFKTQVPSLCM